MLKHLSQKTFSAIIVPAIIASCGGISKSSSKNAGHPSEDPLCESAVGDASEAISEFHGKINTYLEYIFEAKRERTKTSQNTVHDFRRLTLQPHLDHAGNELARVQFLCGPQSEAFKKTWQRYGNETKNYFRAEHIAAHLPEPQRPEGEQRGYTQMAPESQNCNYFIDKINLLIGHYQRRIQQFYRAIDEYERIQSDSDFNKWVWTQQFVGIARAIDWVRQEIEKEKVMSHGACGNSEALMQVLARARRTQTQFNEAFNLLDDVEQKKRIKQLE